MAVCHEAVELHSLQVIFIERCTVCFSLVFVQFKSLWYLNTKFLQPSQHNQLFSQKYCSESPKTYNHKHKKKEHLERSLLAACGSAAAYKQRETLQTYSRYEKTESLHQRPGLNPPAATTVTHLKVCSLICEDLREENILIGRLSNMLFTFSYKLCNRNLFLVSSSSLRDRSWKCSSCNSCIKSCFFHKITKFYFFYTLTGHMW